MDAASISSSSETARVMATAATGSTYSRSTDDSGVTVQTDTVDISDQAKELSVRSPGGLALQLFEGIDTSDGISLDELSGLLNEKSIALKEDLNSLFERAGIDASTEINLTTGYDGSILVNGDHPDKTAIEKLFADDPELSNRFREVDSLASINRAGQEGVEFQKAYARDPNAAVEQYSYLFNSNYKPQFNLSYSAGSISVFFTDFYHSGRKTLNY